MYNNWNLKLQKDEFKLINFSTPQYNFAYMCKSLNCAVFLYSEVVFSSSSEAFSFVQTNLVWFLQLFCLISRLSNKRCPYTHKAQNITHIVLFKRCGYMWIGQKVAKKSITKIARSGYWCKLQITLIGPQCHLIHIFQFKKCTNKIAFPWAAEYCAKER